MTTWQKQEILRLRGEGVDYAGIAEQLGIPKSTVKTFCWRSQKAETPDPFHDLPANICPQCGIAIEQTPRQKPRRFCCDACRRTWWNAHRELMKHRSSYIAICDHCGIKFDHRGKRERRYCSHPHYIAARYGGDPV